MELSCQDRRQLSLELILQCLELALEALVHSHRHQVMVSTLLGQRPGIPNGAQLQIGQLPSSKAMLWALLLLNNRVMRLVLQPRQLNRVTVLL